MDKIIIGLGEVGREAVEIVGGKGANLSELIRSGFPVPPGFVISSRLYRDFFEELGLEEHLDGLDDGSSTDREKLCAAIRECITLTDFPAWASDEVFSFYEKVITNGDPDSVCAVRSSATAEDMAGASFAGQHQTYYYVARPNLLEMIKHCWASLFSPEAVSYRNARELSHAGVHMAVVVQKMIRSEVSGITFTTDPVSGSRDHVVTEASWGMGAAIVDGRVTPDHFVLGRENLTVIKKRIAHKRWLVPADLPAGGLERLEETPSDLRRKETLSPAQIKEVTQWALKAEEHFDSPQDVEWAINQGRYYMLQSRPITTLSREEIGQGIPGKYVLFKPAAENFTEPITPLTQDLIMLVVPGGMRFVKGWAYIDLNLLRTIIPFKASDEELARLMYDLGARPPKMKLSVIKTVFLPLMLFLGYLWLGLIFARTRNMPDNFMDTYRDLCRKMEQDRSCGPAEAMTRLWAWTWQRFFEPIGQMVVLVNLSCVRYIMGIIWLQTMLRFWAPEVRADAAAILCSGVEGVLSAETGRKIWELSQTAKSDPVVLTIFINNKPDRILLKLKEEPKAKPFLDDLESFLAKHGHRGIKELELAMPRWEEDPASVLGMIKNYLQVETDPADCEKKAAEARKKLKEEIRLKLEKRPLEKLLRPRWRLFEIMIQRIRYFSKMRENSRFYHIMSFKVVRRKILDWEKELLEQGRLKCQGDIFFLRWPELCGLMDGQLGWMEVEDRVRKRRLEHNRLSRMLPPKTIGLEIEPKAPTNQDPDKKPDLIKGQAASPGVYEGPAQVIMDPSVNVDLAPGHILVAPYTDPAWTPLFLTAGAAVVEVGSYLSHAGTVAREFGMPCVVDVEDCTSLIQSGNIIRVDGDRGLVHIISKNIEEKK